MQPTEKLNSFTDNINKMHLSEKLKSFIDNINGMHPTQKLGHL